MSVITRISRLNCLRGMTSLFNAPLTTSIKLTSTLKKIPSPIKKNFDEHKKTVGFWLLGCGGMVWAAVTLGGITRLTESGLSMVTWKALGENVPRSAADWEQEFGKYQQFPEYKLKNQNMTLDEFKWIWWMEFAHRSWGRLIGAAFFLPATFFWVTGRLNSSLKKRIFFAGCLLAGQGLMGWYMVKSGLEDRFSGPSDVPRVSQYRLAAHLGLAFTLYVSLLWTALGCILPVEKIKSFSSSTSKIRMLAHSCKGLVFLTAISGAFVAGLDAGLVYNSFPKMADRWIPEDILVLSPKVKNITENPTTVQFDHRILGITTFALINILYFVMRRNKATVPARAKTAATLLLLASWLQVTLGISTLLLYVPTTLAASHQNGSLLLLTLSTWLSHELKHLKKIPK